MKTFNIQKTIEWLEASNLESQNPFRPLRGELDARFSALQVSALARFWENKQINLGTLEEQYKRLIGGFQASATTWGFLVMSEPSRLSLLFLLPGRDCFSQWSGLFHAILPGCEISPGAPILDLTTGLFGLEHVVALTGNPSLPASPPKEKASSLPRARLESVFRSLHYQHWAYLVMARPVGEEEVESSYARLGEEEQELVSSHLRRGTAEENNNPAAKYCLELLQSARQKYEIGRRDGMWDTQTYLFTADQTQLARGIHALSGAFGGPDSSPQPLRVRQCQSSAITSAVDLPITRLTTEEISALACLPAQEFAGYRVKDYVRFAVAPRVPDQIERVSLGTILDDGHPTENWFEIGRDQFSKHVFI